MYEALGSGLRCSHSSWILCLSTLRSSASMSPRVHSSWRKKLRSMNSAIGA